MSGNLKFVYKNKYPIIVRNLFMGLDQDRNEVFEKRAFMYLGPVRVDITDLTNEQIRLTVSKLELMGLITQEGQHHVKRTG